MEEALAKNLTKTGDFVEIDQSFFSACLPKKADPEAFRGKLRDPLSRMGHNDGHAALLRRLRLPAGLGLRGRRLPFSAALFPGLGTG